MGQPVSRDQLQPGDLVFFYSPVSHVGIYIGNGQMVHAPTSGDVVKVARRMIGLPAATTRPPGAVRRVPDPLTCCSSPQTNTARTPPGRCTSQRVTTPGSTLAAPGRPTTSSARAPRRRRLARRRRGGTGSRGPDEVLVAAPSRPGR